MKKTLAALAILLLPMAATGQCPSVDKHKASDPDGLVLGFRYGTPQKLSAFSGGGWTFKPTATCEDYITLTEDLGIGGAELSLGYAVMNRRTGVWRIQESLLRTWGHPWQAATDTWYVGTELQWSYILGFRIGRFYQVGGVRPRRSLTTFSFIAGV
jgi:hypothetical protein